MRNTLALILALSLSACGTQAPKAALASVDTDLVFVQEVWTCETATSKAVVDFNSDSTVRVYWTMADQSFVVHAIGTRSAESIQFSLSDNGVDSLTFSLSNPGMFYSFDSGSEIESSQCSLVATST